jgi:serine/threonine protein kinase
MGQVWLAEQSVPLRRQVAIKILRTGFYSTSTLQRFLAERQSVAIMNHPAIAKVFDAGATPEGQPYLVMELRPRYRHHRLLQPEARFSGKPLT